MSFSSTEMWFEMDLGKCPTGGQDVPRDKQICHDIKSIENLGGIVIEFNCENELVGR